MLHPKLYQRQNIKIFMANIKLLWKDYELIASKFQNFYLKYVKIIDSDGNQVMIESILEAILNVREFSYTFSLDTPAAATPSTIKNILKLKNLRNLKFFYLLNIPEFFHAEDIATFIKDHKDTKIWLEFNSNFTNGYKQNLDHFINTVIKLEYRNSVIKYTGQNKNNLNIMIERFFGKS